jgi:protein CpxP
MTTTMKRLGLAGAATVVAVSLAGGAFAAGQDNPGQAAGPGARQGRFGGPGRAMGPGGPGGPGGGLMALRRLDLTDAQKEQVKTILDSHKDEAKALGEKIMKARVALDAAIAGATFDEATVRTRAAELAALEADGAVARARGYAEVYQILTAEQQTRLKEIQARMQERMANGPRGRGRGPR